MKKIASTKERVPNITTAILCLEKLIERHEYKDDEKLFAEDVERSMDLIAEKIYAHEREVNILKQMIRGIARNALKSLGEE